MAVKKQQVKQYASCVYAMRRLMNSKDHDFLGKTARIGLQSLKVLLHVGFTGQQTMGDLGRAFPVLSLSAITMIVDKLVRKDFLERQRCENDRRVVYVEMAEKGWDLFKSYNLATERTCERALSVLDEKEREVYLQLYSKIVENY